MRGLLIVMTVAALATFAWSLVGPTHQWSNDLSITDIFYHKGPGVYPKETEELVSELETRLRSVEGAQNRDWLIIRWLSGASVVAGVVGLLRSRKRCEEKPSV